jgi:hypothetical protein
MTATEKFDVWIASRVGPQQWAAIEREGAAENAARRLELVGKKRQREAERDQELAELKPKLAAATKRFDAARREFNAAWNEFSFLRRRRTNIGDTAGRDIAKLDRELSESCDLAISRFIAETREAEKALHAQAVREESRPTGRDGVLGPDCQSVFNRPNNRAAGGGGSRGA